MECQRLEIKTLISTQIELRMQAYFCHFIKKTNLISKMAAIQCSKRQTFKIRFNSVHLFRPEGKVKIGKGLEGRISKRCLSRQDKEMNCLKMLKIKIDSNIRTKLNIRRTLES